MSAIESKIIVVIFALHNRIKNKAYLLWCGDTGAAPPADIITENKGVPRSSFFLKNYKIL